MYGYVGNAPTISMLSKFCILSKPCWKVHLLSHLVLISTLSQNFYLLSQYAMTRVLFILRMSTYR
jgi:hypothetical protein